MLIGFIVWSIIALVIIGIGIWSWNSKKAVGFFAGVNPPKIKDVRKYNHSVAVLWFVYAVLFELLGLPLLFYEQNSAVFLLPGLGIPFISIGLMIAYTLMVNKHKK